MKTKKFTISIIFTLWLSTAFSQVYANDNSELNQRNDYLTAMTIAVEQASEVDSKSNIAAARITSFAEFVGTRRYTDVSEYIYSNIEFPEEARICGRSGLVKVRFDIYKNGSIGNIDIIETPDISFSTEVLRLLDKMPNWKPALCGRNTVKSRCQLNINFSLH